MDEYMATMQSLCARFAAWGEQLVQEMTPVFARLAPYLPKQHAVDRRKLSARRARRRSERARTREYYNPRGER